MLRLKVIQKPQGFTLIEVLVAILVASAFIGAVMQVMVSAIALKVAARQRSDITNWIQEDLEFVRYQASTIAQNPSKCNPPDSKDGYAAQLKAIINTKTPSPRTFYNREFQMTRVAEYTTSRNPNRVLNLDYTVTPVGSSNNFMQLRAEVIPDEAFKCSY